MIPKEHHVWCNNFMRPTVKGCSFCDPVDGKSLWDEYPYDNLEEAHGLMIKHFPNNRAR